VEPNVTATTSNYETNAATPTKDYRRNNSKEVVNDLTNNLMWQDDEDVRTVQKNWQGAMDYCQNLNLAGHSDWRLPNLEELKTIVDKNNDPAIKSEFKNTTSYSYWSSTPGAGGSYGAWVVYFSGGGEDSDNEYNYNTVRCVRDSK
jgi:hypothetical protein